MKKRTKIILIGIMILCSLIISLIAIASINQSCVASYEDYVIGGFGGFLIMNNLSALFGCSLGGLILAACYLILYNIRN